FHIARVTTLTTWTVFTTTLWTITTWTTIVAVTTTFETIVTVTELTLRTHRRIWWNDERTFALCHFQQCCSQSFDIQLFAFSGRLNLRQQCTVLIQIAAFQLLLYFRGEFFQTAFAQQFCVWQFSFWNGQLHGAFDVTQQTTLTVFNEQQRTASTTRTTGTADTVNVRLGIHRDVVVHNQADTLNVQTTCCHVGCNQDIQ